VGFGGCVAVGRLVNVFWLSRREGMRVTREEALGERGFG